MRLARPPGSARWHSVSGSPATTFSGLIHRAPGAGTVAALYSSDVLGPTRWFVGEFNYSDLEEATMIWETPAYVDIRLGFEVTMYVYNR